MFVKWGLIYQKVLVLTLKPLNIAKRMSFLDSYHEFLVTNWFLLFQVILKPRDEVDFMAMSVESLLQFFKKKSFPFVGK